MSRPGTLWVVATPIGNLEDITIRARRILDEVPVIAAEDTRRTGRLLQALGVGPKRLVSFFEGNEDRRLPDLLAALRRGMDVALVTDAGTPGISDPGYRLVAACVEAELPVDVAPGPSAALAALVLSGLPTDRFAFEGFLPRSGSARTQRLAALATEPRTAVIFESPRRVTATLADLREHGGDRRVAVVRELTKLHQEIVRGAIHEVLERLGDRELKGEVVLIVEGTSSAAGPGLQQALRIAGDLVRVGVPKREAARLARDLTGVPVREVYQALL